MVVVILIRGWVKRPCGVAEPRLPVIRRLSRSLAVAPDIPVALGVCARRTRLLEPRMLVRSVIGNKIHDHADVAFLRFADHSVEIRERAVKWIDACIVRNVVAEIHQRRRVHRANPNRVEAQGAKVIQSGRNPVDVANAVAVRILEAAGIDLVNNGVLPPQVLCLWTRLLPFRNLRWNLLRQAGACRKAEAGGHGEKDKLKAVQHGGSPGCVTSLERIAQGFAFPPDNPSSSLRNPPAVIARAAWLRGPAESHGMRAGSGADFAALRERRNAVGSAEGERFDGHGGLSAAGSYQAAAVAK